MKYTSGVLKQRNINSMKILETIIFMSENFPIYSTHVMTLKLLSRGHHMTINCLSRTSVEECTQSVGRPTGWPLRSSVAMVTGGSQTSGAWAAPSTRWPPPNLRGELAGTVW